MLKRSAILTCLAFTPIAGGAATTSWFTRTFNALEYSDCAEVRLIEHWSSGVETEWKPEGAAENWKRCQVRHRETDCTGWEAHVSYTRVENGRAEWKLIRLRLGGWSCPQDVAPPNDKHLFSTTVDVIDLLPSPGSAEAPPSLTVSR
jgi:hypothetical protein